jgi:cytoskeletal protein RodZ
MKEIGKLLKEKREKLQLSYTDAHRVTKIQEKYLKAIEDGEIKVFFAPVYYKSFVRSYSKFLGFEPEEIISMINLKHEQKILKNEAERANTKKNNCKNSDDIKKVLIVFGILLTLILIVLIMFFNKKVVNIDNESKNFESVMSVGSVEPIQNEKDEKLPVNLAEDSISISPNKQKEIEIIANETVWIRLEDQDSKTIYEGNLNKGQRKVWKADKNFRLKMGYAPGLKVFFNGQEIDVVKNAVQDVNTIILE